MIDGRRLVAPLALLWACGVSIDCAAQAYPQRPVRLVVPAPVGGGPTDTPARPVADALSNLVKMSGVKVD